MVKKNHKYIYDSTQFLLHMAGKCRSIVFGTIFKEKNSLLFNVLLHTKCTITTRNNKPLKSENK